MPGATAARTEVRDITRLTLRAAFQPATFNPEKRTVEVVWTTGAKGLRRGWDYDYYEELSLAEGDVRLERLNSGAPLLDSHRSWGGVGAVLAVVERAWITDGQGRALVRFSERDDVKPIMRDVETGILPNISVGYDVYKYERIRSIGEDGKPDGKPDTYRAVDWEPMEVSLVPMPFDIGAQVRGQAGAHPHVFPELANHTHQIAAGAPVERTHKVTIFTRGTAAEIEETEMPTETIPASDAAQQTESRVAAAVQTALATERARVTDIRTLVARAGLENTLADTLVADVAMTVDKAREQVIDAMAAKQKTEQGRSRSQSGVEMGATDGEKWQEGAFNWLVRKAAVGSYFPDAAKMDPGEFRGLTLVDLARGALERMGVKTRGMDKMALVGKALTHRDAGAYNGVNDFAVLLENTMHKILLGAFAVAPDTWKLWCKIGSVSDFRAHNRYRLGSFGTLDRKNEHGEFKNKQIPDGSKEIISIITKGNIIGLSREALINDDMGAFNSLATAFGRMAGLTLEVDAYAALALNGGLGPLLVDGNPVFHDRSATTGSNIGTGSALTIAGVDADRQLMAMQKDLSGNEYLDLRPSILLTPLSLGGTARQINEAEYDIDVSNKYKVPNKVRGTYSKIVDTPRISGTRRYSFADPNTAPTIEMAFLDGNQTPYLENKDGWRTDGVEWKVRMDAGVAGVGYQGAVTNAGAP